jgi:hypothetical protein
MPIFRCLVRGERFPFMIDGAWKTIGFYTTRFVEADSPGAAEMVTLDLLQGEEALQREETAPGLEHAHVFFEEIEEVSEAGLNSGFIFFDEEAS